MQTVQTWNWVDTWTPLDLRSILFLDFRCSLESNWLSNWIVQLSSWWGREKILLDICMSCGLRFLLLRGANYRNGHCILRPTWPITFLKVDCCYLSGSMNPSLLLFCITSVLLLGTLTFIDNLLLNSRVFGTCFYFLSFFYQSFISCAKYEVFIHVLNCWILVGVQSLLWLVTRL